MAIFGPQDANPRHTRVVFVARITLIVLFTLAVVGGGCAGTPRPAIDGDGARTRAQQDLRLQVQLGHQTGADRVELSPDGELLATASRYGSVIKLWDLRSGLILNELVCHSGGVVDLEFTRGGERLFSVGHSGEICEWTVSTGELGRIVRSDPLPMSPEDNEPLSGFSMSSDGSVLFALQGMKRTPRIWTEQPEYLGLDQADVTRVEFSSDRSTILVQNGKGSNAQVELIDVSRTAVREFEKPAEIVDVGPSRQQFAVRIEGAVHVHDFTDGSRLASLPVDAGAEVTLLSGGLVVAKTRTGLDVYSSETGARQSQVEVEPRSNGEVWAVSRDGALAATGDPVQPSIHVYDLHTGKRVAEFETTAKALVFSGDASRLVVNNAEGTEFWDVKGGVRTSFVPSSGMKKKGGGLFEQASHVPAISDDGSMLCVGHPDGRVEVWDLRTLTRIRELSAGSLAVDAVAFSPDGRWLAVGTRSRLQVLDLRDGTVVHERAISAKEVMFDDTGQKLAAGGTVLEVGSWNESGRVNMGFPNELFIDRRDGNTRHFYAVEGATVTYERQVKRGARAYETVESVVFRGHRGTVQRLSLSRDRRWLASSTRHGVTRVWDTETGTAISLLSRDNQWILWSDDGFFDASPGGTGLLAAVAGQRAFPLGQLALVRNRPSRVLAVHGGSEALREHFERVYERRLERSGLGQLRDAEAGFDGLPTARMTSADSTGGVASIEFELRSSAGLAGYRVFVDGTPETRAWVPVGGETSTHEVDVELRTGSNRIQVAAIDRSGAESFRAQVTLEREEPHPSRLFYVGLGVSDYRHSGERLPDLQWAAQDARDLEAAFALQRSSEREVSTLTLTDADVDMAVLDRVRQFLATATIHDDVVFFVAGHGVRIGDVDGEYFYLTSVSDPSSLASTSLAFAELERVLYESPARRKLMLLDTCQSGEDIDYEAIAGTTDTTTRARAARGLVLNTGNDVTRRPTISSVDRLIYANLFSRSGTVVLASSTGRESSLESAIWENGAYSEVLLEALFGAADTDADGVVSVAELRRFVVREVPRLTEGRQHPLLHSDNPEGRMGFEVATTDSGPVDEP